MSSNTPWPRKLIEFFRESPRYRGIQTLKAFTEFFGPNSFAGLHKADDPKELRLFDVLAESFGFIGPSQFVADFGHLPIARIIYEGRATGKFIEDVHTSKYEVTEGVVCKERNRRRDLWMIKIKTNAYMRAIEKGIRRSMGGLLGVTMP